MAMENKKPEQPEVLMLLRLMRRMNVNYCVGGYKAMPHILVWEIRMVNDAEIEVEKEGVVSSLQKRIDAQFEQQSKGDGRVA